MAVVKANYVKGEGRGIQSMVWVLLGILLVIGDLRMPEAGSFEGLGDIGTLMIVALMYQLWHNRGPAL